MTKLNKRRRKLFGKSVESFGQKLSGSREATGSCGSAANGFFIIVGKVVTLMCKKKIRGCRTLCEKNVN